MAAAAGALSLAPWLELSGGIRLPRVGLGTFKLRGPDVATAVQCALDIGLRHIDTASIYKNEAEIAGALAAARLPREEVFVTSKISPYQMGTDKARKACEASLAALGGYVDLMLIHWPGVAKTPADSPRNAQARRETWQVLESYQRQGLFRSIGVSNYGVAHLQELLSYAEVQPAANQVECHPRFPQSELRAFCEEQGIALIAYSPLGTGELLRDPGVEAVAAAAGLTPAQALLCWGLQHGLAVIPKSSEPKHIAQFEPGRLLAQPLGPEQMEALDALALHDVQRYCWDPSRVV